MKRISLGLLKGRCSVSSICVEVVQHQHCTAALPEQLTAFGDGFSSIKKREEKKRQH